MAPASSGVAESLKQCHFGAMRVDVVGRAARFR